MKQEILIKKKSKIYSKFPEGSPEDTTAAASFNAELMQHGYMLTLSAFEHVSQLNNGDLSALYVDVTSTLAKLRGSHVTHKPMYKNFPQEVMEKSLAELYINAIIHYMSFGIWVPESVEVIREVGFEPAEFTMLDVGGEYELTKVLNEIVGSKDSISETDKRYVKFLLDNNYSLKAEIGYKENLCFVAGVLFDQGKDITGVLTTATDILRFITYLSDGDISLSSNTKFKSLNRSLRKKLVAALDKCINEDDIARHENKWKRAFHMLHVGDYAKKYKNVYRIAQKVRESEALKTFNSKVERFIEDGKIVSLLSLLQTRPGELHRRMDYLLRSYSHREQAHAILNSYAEVVDKIPNRLLFQMVGHIKSYENGHSDNMVVFPKGKTQKGLLIPRNDKPKSLYLNNLDIIVSKQIVKNFSELESWKGKKVWIDPALNDCPLPTQQRSASEGMVDLARGTKFDMGDKSHLRFFVYWKGRDIDLSATFHDENFNLTSHVSWTDLRGAGYTHSGDITYAPKGASEFIDMNVSEMVKRGTRYVCMNVYSFSGPLFKEISECFAGWMTLDNPTKNSVFQPKQVKNKIDLKSDTTFCIPVVFDLVERKVIWIDLQNRPAFGRSRMVEENKLTIEKTLKLAAIKSETSCSLGSLFIAHTSARGGEFVDSPEQADIKFGMDRETCDVTPFDVNTINSEYV